MKTNKSSSESLFYSFLDKYIYYVVVNKRHKQFVNKYQDIDIINNTSEIFVV